MEILKHTPGPWSCEYEADFDAVVVRDANVSMICLIDDRRLDDMTDDQCVATLADMEETGQLIAQAPDLKKALGEIVMGNMCGVEKQGAVICFYCSGPANEENDQGFDHRDDCVFFNGLRVYLGINKGEPV